jgi:tetratricopeptide (TPR) repeat protein
LAEKELAEVWRNHPGQESLRKDLCLVRLNLGLELGKLGQKDEAAALITSAVKHVRESLERAPDDLPMQRRLAIGLSFLGSLQTESQPGTNFLQEAMAIHRDLSAREPHRAEHLFELAAAMNHLGSLRVGYGNVESAEKLFEESLAIHRRLLTHSPGIDSIRSQLAATLNNLGMVRLDTDLAGAESLFEESLSLLRGLVQKSPDDLLLRSELAAAINNRGLVWERQGKLHDAIAAFRQAVSEQEAAGEVPLHRAQLDRLKSNLVRAQQIGQQQTPNAAIEAQSLTTSRDRRMHGSDATNFTNAG